MTEVDELEEGVAASLRAWSLDLRAELLEEQAAGLMADSEQSREWRDEHQKEVAADEIVGTRLWYKFHGQSQAYRVSARRALKAAGEMREQADALRRG